MKFSQPISKTKGVWPFLWAGVVMLFFSCVRSSGGFVNGMKLPDIQINDIQHHPVRLSDYRGNIVLLDIWASWCRPCRKMHPQLAALYAKYENAAFTHAYRFVVISVSLDSNKENWQKAIADDQVEKFIHLSELNGWQSSIVNLYQIHAIPASFLLDENGVIIGKNLTPKEIDKILLKRLK